MGKVKFSNAKVATDVSNARSRAYELAKRLQGGSPTARKEIADDFYFFEGNARYAFANALVEQFGRRSRDTESDSEWKNNVCIAHTTGNWIIPIDTKTTVVQGGITYQFFAQIFEETSHSVSVEVFTQSQVSVEAGAGVEGKLGPVKFTLGVKGSVTKGHKSTDKDETKNATRVGRTASRTFVARRVSHEVILIRWDKAYHGVCQPTGYGIGVGQMADKVNYDQRDLNFITELGYELVPSEGGANYGPYWPDYSPSGAEIEGTSQERVREQLSKLQKQLAEDLASGKTP